MAEKTLVVSVCDMPHRKDRQAVAKITIDVCSTHYEAIGNAMKPEMHFECKCGHQTVLEKGMSMHQAAYRKNGQAKAHNEYFELEAEPA